MKKRYFVLWSGGLDSTYLIIKLLEQGYVVHAGYIEVKNNENKTKRELKAIENILPTFSTYSNFKYHNIISSLEIKSHNDSIVYLKQAPIWLFGTLYSIPSGVNRIAIAYCMNDDAISYLSEINRIFNSIKLLGEKSNLKLEFPLTKTQKKYIIEDMFYNHPNLLKYITFCESIDDQDNCGGCHPCLRWKMLEQEIDRDTFKDFIRFS